MNAVKKLRPDQIVRATSECQTVAQTGKKLNDAFLKVVKDPILSVWNDIAADVLACGGRQSNAANIEMCIDADRLWYMKTYWGKGSENEGIYADEAVSVAYSAHGGAKVLRFLSKHIKLGF